MLPVGFEPTISAGERPQAHALDRAVTGTGSIPLLKVKVSRERPRWLKRFLVD